MNTKKKPKQKLTSQTRKLRDLPTKKDAKGGTGIPGGGGGTRIGGGGGHP
jgi:hypothetical protein